MDEPAGRGEDSPLEFYPRFPVGPPLPFAMEPVDVRNLPPLKITLEESEDQAGWGPIEPPA